MLRQPSRGSVKTSTCSAEVARRSWPSVTPPAHFTWQVFLATRNFRSRIPASPGRCWCRGFTGQAQMPARPKNLIWRGRQQIRREIGISRHPRYRDAASAGLVRDRPATARCARRKAQRAAVQFSRPLPAHDGAKGARQPGFDLCARCLQWRPRRANTGTGPGNRSKGPALRRTRKVMLPTSAFEERRHRDDVRPFGFDDDFAGSGRREWWARQGSNL